jgi:hypothetical protein
LSGSLVCALLAVTIAGGCGSSSGALSSARVPALGVRVTPAAASLLSRNPTYRGATGDFCSNMPNLPELDSDANLNADAADVLAERRVLGGIRGALVVLRVPPTEQENLKSYLIALEYELGLDARISSDQKAGDGEDETVALEQHTFNSRERSELASKLGIRCLIQADPR